jgi:hypothetical protein
MSQAINFCQDSDDKGEWSSTNATSAPSLPLTRKRARDKDESFSDAHHPSNENDPNNKPATGSVDFVVDLELADKVEVSVSPHKRKRRHAVNNKQSAKNGTVGKYARILKGVEATEEDVGIEDAQVADHRESHEGVIAAEAASHPMNSVSEQNRRDDGSASKYSEKLSTSRSPSKESGRQSKVSAWEVRLSELADYRRIHGHCNVPQRYSENTKLGSWVGTQRSQYRFHVDGKRSFMTLSRIQELESLRF